MRMRIAEQWDSYARATMPANASTTQRWETRRAFYAGVQAFYHLQMTAFEGGEEATEADLKIMEEIDSELRQFVQSVKDGRA